MPQPAAFSIEQEEANPNRRLAFKLALVLVFLRFSMLHQLLAYKLHANVFLLYFFAVPALLGIAVTGGIRRTFAGRPAFYWLAFAAWVGFGMPFSYWISGSLHSYVSYIRTDFPMLFVMAGLAVTWRECVLLMRSIAAGALVNLFTARFFDNTDGGRLSLDVGTIANSNDFAAHLLLVLPFLLWAGFQAKSVVVRVTAFSGVAYGLLLILKTASRGGALGLAAGALVYFLLAPARQRFAMLAIAPALLALLLAFVPHTALERIRSFSTTDPTSAADAVESSESRRYLLNQSIAYTFQHPLFGVGMRQFSDYEGRNNQIIGTHGLWHETHNVFTQVSAECGIPALLFFVAALGSTFRLFIRIYRETAFRPDCKDIRSEAACVIVALAGFCTAITFLNFAYFFYLPAMGGLAIVATGAARREMQRRKYQPVILAPWAAPAPPASQAAVRAARIRAARRWDRIA